MPRLCASVASLRCFILATAPDAATVPGCEALPGRLPKKPARASATPSLLSLAPLIRGPDALRPVSILPRMSLKCLPLALLRRLLAAEGDPDASVMDNPSEAWLKPASLVVLSVPMDRSDSRRRRGILPVRAASSWSGGSPTVKCSLTFSPSATSNSHTDMSDVGLLNSLCTSAGEHH